MKGSKGGLHILLSTPCFGLAALVRGQQLSDLQQGDEAVREIGILFPNNQRQHRTLHIQKDVLPYALKQS